MPTAARTHKPGRSAARVHPTRPSRSNRGYDWDWYKFRRWYLRRHPLCVDMHGIGCKRAATEIDHVVRLVSGGAKFDEKNLQALCKSCHSKKTRAEQDG